MAASVPDAALVVVLAALLVGAVPAGAAASEGPAATGDSVGMAGSVDAQPTDDGAAVASAVGSDATLAEAPPAALAGEAYVFFESTTTPAQPTAGEEFTLRTTFRSAAASDEPLRIDEIEVRAGPGDDAEVLEERTFLGEESPELDPDGSVAQTFDLTFDDPGARELAVAVTFVDREGEHTVVTYRANVTVYDPHPRVEVTAAPTTAGESTSLDVSVANGLAEGVRDVDLSVSAADASVDDPDRVASGIAAGETRTFEFTATPETLGRLPVEVTLGYTTADGTRRTLTRTVDVRFRPYDAEGDLGLAAEVAPAMPGAETTLNLTVANGLDRALREFEVTVEAEGVVVRQQRRVGTGFASGAERTFTFDVTRESSGDQQVAVTVRFTTADGVEGQVTETLSTTFRPPDNPGEIRLTGAEAVQRGSTLEVSATASNVGAGDVSAVVVSLPDDGPVVGTDYFVGSVEGSDFASFTLSTSLTGNVSSVPLTVTYVVDGVERSRTTEVSVQRQVVERPGGGGGGLPLLPAVGVVGLLVVAGVVYRRRG